MAVASESLLPGNLGRDRPFLTLDPLSAREFEKSSFLLLLFYFEDKPGAVCFQADHPLWTLRDSGRGFRQLVLPPPASPPFSFAVWTRTSHPRCGITRSPHVKPPCPPPPTGRGDTIYDGG